MNWSGKRPSPSTQRRCRLYSSKSWVYQGLPGFQGDTTNKKSTNNIQTFEEGLQRTSPISYFRYSIRIIRTSPISYFPLQYIIRLVSLHVIRIKHPPSFACCCAGVSELWSASSSMMSFFEYFDPSCEALALALSGGRLPCRCEYPPLGLPTFMPAELRHYYHSVAGT